MEKRYIVTGAAGHLGTALLHRLEEQKAEVFALVLPGQAGRDRGNIHYVEGDVCDPKSLRPLFAGAQERELYMIHAAGMMPLGRLWEERHQSPAFLVAEVSISLV